MVCTLIDNDTRHHSVQNAVDSLGYAWSVYNQFWPRWWRVSLSIGVQTTINNNRFVFNHNINVKENVFFRARAEKALRDIDNDNGNDKLTNQSTRLAAMVVKNHFKINESFLPLPHFLLFLLIPQSLTLPIFLSFCSPKECSVIFLFVICQTTASFALSVLRA